MIELPRTVFADPGWRPKLHANTKGRSSGPYRAGPQRYYTTLSVGQICEMKPETQPKAHLWLWVLSQHTDWGHEVALAWGFDEYVTMLTWNKPGLGTGQFQCNTEHILLYRKGGSVGNAFGKTGGTGFRWPRPPGKIHSAKPPEAYALCERVSPGPYYEMYARQRRENWTQMGDQLK